MKSHIPSPGEVSGREGPALCGKWARYATGDLSLITRLAAMAVRDSDTGAWCAGCIARLAKRIRMIDKEAQK